jgi:uncharacterized membrane protein YfcA
MDVAVQVWLFAVAVFLLAGLDKDELVQALGLSFTVSTLALAAGLLHGSPLPAASLWMSLLSVAPALAGMALGQMIRRRVAAETFRKVFFAGLLVLGAYLALRSIA